MTPVQSQASGANNRGSNEEGKEVVEDFVQYSSKETTCYICKENLEVTIDNEDENWYFKKAKKIKFISPTDPNQRIVVIVHSDCVKQVQMQKEPELSQGRGLREDLGVEQSVLGKREGMNGEEVEEGTEVREKIEKMVRGIEDFKRPK